MITAEQADRLAEQALADADKRGQPYTVPVTSRIDYRMALAIARSAHPVRVLAHTRVYRYGRFTEHEGVVFVTMMGSNIATFYPAGVELRACGHATPTTSEALSALVTGGYFFHEDGKLIFSRFGIVTSRTVHTDGQTYPYV